MQNSFSEFKASPTGSNKTLTYADTIRYQENCKPALKHCARIQRGTQGNSNAALYGRAGMGTTIV